MGAAAFFSFESITEGRQRSRSLKSSFDMRERAVLLGHHTRSRQVIEGRHSTKLKAAFAHNLCRHDALRCSDRTIAATANASGRDREPPGTAPTANTHLDPRLVGRESVFGRHGGCRGRLVAMRIFHFGINRDDHVKTAAVWRKPNLRLANGLANGGNESRPIRVVTRD